MIFNEHILHKFLNYRNLNILIYGSNIELLNNLTVELDNKQYNTIDYKQLNDMYFINNISKTKFKNNFTHLRMDSKKGYDLLSKLNIKLDFCYIDGSHYYKDIKFEIENFNKILVNESEYKGFVCGDDCEIGYDELIKKVDKIKLDELFSNVKKYDFIKNFDNKNINFHPGVTLAIKDSGLPIKITPSGFWYKL